MIAVDEAPVLIHGGEEVHPIQVVCSCGAKTPWYFVNAQPEERSGDGVVKQGKPWRWVIASVPCERFAKVARYGAVPLEVIPRSPIATEFDRLKGDFPEIARHLAKVLGTDGEDRSIEGALFDLGTVLLSNGIARTLSQVGLHPDTIRNWCLRHAQGDFGDVGQYGDVEMDDRSREHPMLCSLVVQNRHAIDSLHGLVISRWTYAYDERRTPDQIAIATKITPSGTNATVIWSPNRDSIPAIP